MAGLVVIITHNQAIARQAHRVVTIRDGLVESVRERRESEEFLPAR